MQYISVNIMFKDTRSNTRDSVTMLIMERLIVFCRTITNMNTFERQETTELIDIIGTHFP